MARVRNITGRTGRPVVNQFIIETRDGDYFQSYQTVIAFREPSGKVWLDRDRWDYSTTTGKYRNGFLGMNKAETERAIKAGQIGLTNLNRDPQAPIYGSMMD
jgi:hypothetical protein